MESIVLYYITLQHYTALHYIMYQGADKSLAWPGRKQATVTTKI